MTNILDLSNKLAEKCSIDYYDSIDLLEALLDLKENQMMFVSNIRGELRYEIVPARRFFIDL